MDKAEARDKIFRLAVTSRVAVLLLQLVAKNLLPNHQTETFTSPPSPSDVPRPLDAVVSFFLGGLLRWDGQYFLHVARYGYTYMNTLAFFPLLPMAGSLIASLVSPLTVLISPALLFLLIFTALNFYCFVRAAVSLYDLGLLLFSHNSPIPYRSAVLFCFSPASIFFSAPYSESIFALLTFGGLARLHSQSQPLSSVTALALSTACRSNGLLNILHPLLLYLRQQRLHLVVLSAILIPFPFLLFQVFSYGRFCLDPNYSLPPFLLEHAQENEYLAAGGEPPPFCNDGFQLPYQYVQSYHWDVGFLRYFSWRQLPNFMLVVPLLILVLPLGWNFFWNYPHYCLTLGLMGERPKTVPEGLPPSIMPLVLHEVFLTVFCFFCIHVQVSTRMIASSCPAFYWMSAQWTCHSKNTRAEPKEYGQNAWRCFLLCDKFQDWRGNFVRLYFLGYFIAGSVMFSLNLPWT